jgi:hypothetical protein
MGFSGAIPLFENSGPRILRTASQTLTAAWRSCGILRGGHIRQSNCTQSISATEGGDNVNTLHAVLELVQGISIQYPGYTGTAMDLAATNLSQSQLVLAICTELVGQAAPLPGSLLSLFSTPTGSDSDARIL